MTLAAIARIVGGNIVRDPLETSARGLRARVLRCSAQFTYDETFHIAVDTARRNMTLAPGVLPMLPHGYVFTGYIDNGLYAVPTRPNTPEEIADALDRLALFAHEARPASRGVASMRAPRGAPETTWWQIAWWRFRGWLHERRASVLVALLVCALLWR